MSLPALRQPAAIKGPLLATIWRGTLDGLAMVLKLSKDKHRLDSPNYGIYFDFSAQRLVAVNDQAALLVRDCRLDADFKRSFVLPLNVCEALLQYGQASGTVFTLRLTRKGPTNCFVSINPAPRDVSTLCLNYSELKYEQLFPMPSRELAQIDTYVYRLMYVAMRSVVRQSVHLETTFNGKGPILLNCVDHHHLVGSMQPLSRSPRSDLHRALAGVGLCKPIPLKT